MKIRSVTAELVHADGQTDKKDEAKKWLFETLRKRLKTYINLIKYKFNP